MRIAIIRSEIKLSVNQGAPYYVVEKCCLCPDPGKCYRMQ